MIAGLLLPKGVTNTKLFRTWATVTTCVPSVQRSGQGQAQDQEQEEEEEEEEGGLSMNSLFDSLKT
jgi:hypothetical protein